MVELVMAFSLPPDLFDREMTTEPYSKGIRGSLERASANASRGAEDPELVDVVVRAHRHSAQQESFSGSLKREIAMILRASAIVG